MRGEMAWLLCSGCIVGGGEGLFRFEDATGLDVSLANGSVEATSSADLALEVEYDGGGFGRAAYPEVSQDDDGIVTVDGRGQFGGGDVVARLPAELPMAVLVDRGDVTVTLDHPADVDACVGAGSVTLRLPPADYDLELGAGAGSLDVSVPDVDGGDYRITVCAGAGSITVEPVVPDGDGSSRHQAR